VLLNSLAIVRPVRSGQTFGVDVGVGVGVQVGVGVNVGVGVIVGVADAVAVGVGEGVRVAVAVAETDAAETAKLPGSPITLHPANSSKSNKPRHHRRTTISDMPTPPQKI